VTLADDIAGWPWFSICSVLRNLQALYKWMTETGPVYLLPTGPISSFLVKMQWVVKELALWTHPPQQCKEEQQPYH